MSPVLTCLSSGLVMWPGASHAGSLAPQGGNCLFPQEPPLRWDVVQVPMGSHTFSWASGLRVASECCPCCRGSRKRLFGVKRHPLPPPHSPPAASSGSIMPGSHCRELTSSCHRAGGAQEGLPGRGVSLVTTCSPLTSAFVFCFYCGKCTSYKLYHFNYL